MMTLGNIFGTFFSYSYKVYGSSSGSHQPISEQTLTWAASIGSGIINGLSRIVLGGVVDRVRFKTLFMILMGIQLVNSLVCYWAAYVPAIYFMCVMFNYAALGGLFAIFPVAVTNVFGLEIGPKIYVWVILGSFFSSCINLLETTVLIDAIGFAAIFYVNSVLQLLCLVVTYFYEEKLDVENLRKYNALK